MKNGGNDELVLQFSLPLLLFKASFNPFIVRSTFAMHQIYSKSSITLKICSAYQFSYYDLCFVSLGERCMSTQSAFRAKLTPGLRQ